MGYPPAQQQQHDRSIDNHFPEVVLARAHPEKVQQPQPGSMMDRPLLVSAILEHGENQYGDQQIASRDTDGSLHRYRFADMARRARQLANALQALGLRPGSVVGSLA